MWPLPFGISYNSYIIVDKKIALIDTIDECFEREYLEKIKEEIGSRAIDYLVVNHMEPDHSSLISLILDIYPGFLVVADAKALPMLKGYYGLSEDDVLIVRDGSKLNLGLCELSFHMTPMVHWPETMMTWLGAEKTLFSGDAFGMYRNEMIRYYSNIVGKYGSAVQTALKKISGLTIERICSTHGPVWEKQVPE